MDLYTKAGWFVGKAGCYAVVALADNATFSLAVNRMVAFQTVPHTGLIVYIATVALLGPSNNFFLFFCFFLSPFPPPSNRPLCTFFGATSRGSVS